MKRWKTIDYAPGFKDQRCEAILAYICQREAHNTEQGNIRLLGSFL
jgi:hypothetical protein